MLSVEQLSTINISKSSDGQFCLTRLSIANPKYRLLFCVGIMIDIRKKYNRLGKRGLDKMIDSKCNWLFNNYTNIFNRLKKNELDLHILSRFLSTLKEIEDSEVDQHEGSVKVGQILKELYIDSAMKEEKKREKKKNKNKKKFKKPENKLTWAQYKQMNYK